MLVDSIIFPENYSVSSDGYVVSKKTGKMLKPSILKFGYHRVGLSSGKERRCLLLHRLVYFSFRGGSIDFKSHQDGVVMHINDNVSDNRLCNLKLGNQMENVRDMIGKGRMKRGFVKKMKLSYDVRDRIIQMRKNGMKLHEIAEMYGVTKPAICRLVKGKTWNKM